MIVLVLLTLILAGGGVVLVLRGALDPRGVIDTLGQIDAYGYRARQVEEKQSFSLVGLLGSAAGRLGNLAVGRIPRFREADLRKLLVSAGFYKLDPRRFLGYQVLGAIFAAGLGLMLGRAAGFPVVARIVMTLGAIALGFYLPMFFVKRRARQRLEKIEYELPELVDLLVVTIEAGIGFIAALQLASTRLEGPLADELRLTLQEQRLGLSVTEALRNMMYRAETPSMRSFVRAILQGEQLGVSIGQVMRNLAIEMRKKRKAAAEERAQKAPIKMLFPLVFLIFPAMFVVILGPAVIQIFKVLG